MFKSFTYINLYREVVHPLCINKVVKYELILENIK